MLNRILGWFYPSYNNYDPRTAEWFLMSGPEPVIIIVAMYLYFCTSAGPRFMRDKPPYTLRKAMILHNLIQVFFNIYLFREGLMGGWLYEYSYSCQPIVYSKSPSALRIARAAHLYFICKIIQLLDTVFVVLRKKDRQLSLYHVCYHVTAVTYSWIGVRYMANGHSTFLALLNCIVLTFVYSYYLLAAIGPKVRKCLVWKKYLTALQILRFVIVDLHTLQVFFSDCAVPKSIALGTIVISTTFTYMLVSFYVQNYHKSNVDNVACVGVSKNSSASQKSDKKRFSSSN
ncbi:elongation of very long chain fatty acids protein 7-like [Diprion similis]|uniref:elongation of very long chain fatty acids protein 7-like n=1 Tax=Diprion similis TaxID=362088 RepID=UPI001EF84028|nr:elongation of very long chain fatty acids protein 7-like [Diprion similis]XP_046733765.1 elongation of very long chain fatty acids protein 7-like [Diprion similis]XP_046733766.1 elongation of very long chain fatty acids protein 7-like [Diprion similis]XP_046733767.1 elongation of very long chain fatty acids protein 7-like [Diprion similis]XP_046733768.1 elongation of very long chain fatty acids protein 7-like [Diprion similis]